MIEKKHLKQRIRGWYPKEPLIGVHLTKPEVRKEQDEEISRQLVKWMAITNSIIGPTVFAVNNFDLKNFALFFSEFALVSVVTNIAIYLYLRHRIYGGT